VLIAAADVHTVIATVAELINISSSSGVKILAVIIIAIIWESKQILRNIAATKTMIITTITTITITTTAAITAIELIA